MNDSEDLDGEAQYHLEAGLTDLTDTVLPPGNPERVDKMTVLWNDHEEKASHHEYRTATGSYDGTSILAASAGIGSPSAAIAVEKLARVGVGTFICVGSCGAIQPEMDVDGLVITPGAVRQEGTSKEYTRENYPVVAGHEVVPTLVAAAERLGYDYHAGLAIGADSFYAGQGRSGSESFRAAGSDSPVEELREVNVRNTEMEAATLLTIANVYGLRAGAVCSVYANHVTDKFRTEGESRVTETVSLAVYLLVKMDEAKRRTGVDRWHASLSLD